MVTQPISLNDALDSIASSFGFDAETLIEYAALDPHGGYHDKYDDGFPTGSIWRVEGQVLYALARALYAVRHNSALHILELGTHRGCSATHIAQALHDADRDTSTDWHRIAEVICVDINPAAGDLIPIHLKRKIELVNMDMFEFLARQSDDMQPKFDLILEDGSHHTEDVERVWRAAYHLLKPGGVIISHDAEHLHVPSNTGVGAAVREGIARAGFYALVPPVRTYKVQPSDCGFAVYRKPLEPVGQDYVPLEDKQKNDEVPSIGDLLAKQDLSSLTIAQLKDFAAQRDISLTGTRTKGEIIAAIKAVTG